MLLDLQNWQNSDSQKSCFPVSKHFYASLSVVVGTVLVMAKAELPSTKSDTAAGVLKSPVLGEWEESLVS
jgi:hypothetical protein